MGVLYIMAPLDDSGAAWLDSEGIAHPSPSPTNRNPTPAEIVEVLRGLSDYAFEVRFDANARTWYADVSRAANPSAGPWTEIVVGDYGGDDVPKPVSFRKGCEEVILSIVERLTHFCGPLIVTDDSCTLPYLVEPGMLLDEMVREYDARC